MFSKSHIRFVQSLQHKKFRKHHGAFVVEGAKSVMEFIQSEYKLLRVYSASGEHTKMGKIPDNIKLIDVSDADLKKISFLKTPQYVLAVVQIPSFDFDVVAMKGEFTLLLDGVQDPGNLGTIIRIADWFGIERLLCSRDCADVYNPKTVQASMGSLSRIKVFYLDLPEFLEHQTLPVYGALLDGSSIYTADVTKEGLMVLGNEGKGISKEVQAYIDFPVTIPRFGQAESLNVAASAAIICSEIARRM